MSRMIRALALACFGFPRVSGDEPRDDTIDSIMLMFSPRERG